MPSWSTGEIKPGEKGFVNVQYKAMNRPGKFNKTAKVYVDKIKGITVLKVKGVVIPTPGKLRKKIGRLNFEDNRIDFDKVHLDEKVSKTIEFNNPNSEVYELTVQEKPDYISVEIIPNIIKPKQKGKIKITFDSKLKSEYGKIIDKVRFNMTTKKKEMIGAISVTTNVVEDFSKLTEKELQNAPVISISTKKADFGIITPKEKMIVDVGYSNQGKRDLIIHTIDINNKRVRLDHYDKIVKPGAEGKITLSSTPLKFNDNLRGTIKIISNDPKHSVITINSMAKVAELPVSKKKSELSDDGFKIKIKKVIGMIKSDGAKEKLVLLDVRTEKEFNKGHIKNAVNMNVEDKNFSKKAKLLNKNKYYVVYCEKGVRSYEAVMILRELGLNNSFNMVEGYRGWLKYQGK